MRLLVAVQPRVTAMFGRAPRDSLTVAVGAGRGRPVIDIGCGPVPRPQPSIGVDTLAPVPPGIRLDLERGLGCIRSDSIGVVHASHPGAHPRVRTC